MGYFYGIYSICNKGIMQRTGVYSIFVFYYNNSGRAAGTYYKFYNNRKKSCHARHYARICICYAGYSANASAVFLLLRTSFNSRSWKISHTGKIQCRCFDIYSAYLAEIFRGGLLSIDVGQYEAASVLGFSKLQTRIHVVMPQMFKVVLPSVSNEAITLIKDTALVTSIGIADLLHYTKSMVNHYVDVTPYIIAAIIYLLMTYGLTKFFAYLERRFMF